MLKLLWKWLKFWKPACPYCKSHNVNGGAGWWYCNNCEKEFST